MVEIDKAFHSLAEWTEWAAENGSVYVAGEADEVGARICATGFVEPLTGRLVAGADIQHTGTNWREGLLSGGQNSRMRAVLAVIEEVAGPAHPSLVRIFATEAVTAFALCLRGRFARFLGSEYGMDEQARRELYPIAHQDLTALTLPSDCFDIVTTNEVLEHVPDLDAALREIARVLRPGGWHVGTHPFLFTAESGDRRAILVEGAVVHLKPPEYHGNPGDPAGGSLVFETPGWDILERARQAGLAHAHMRFIASERHGVLTENMGVFVFCAQKAARQVANTPSPPPKEIQVDTTQPVAGSYAIKLQEQIEQFRNIEEMHALPAVFTFGPKPIWGRAWPRCSAPPTSTCSTSKRSSPPPGTARASRPFSASAVARAR